MTPEMHGILFVRKLFYHADAQWLENKIKKWHVTLHWTQMADGILEF